MTAASFWSLLLPALEIGDQINGNNKMQTLIPVILGFLLGAFFVFITDILLPDNVSQLFFRFSRPDLRSLNILYI
jgi:zinc transporter ZupT